MIRVFVSGPYTSDPEGNTEKALALATELLDLGFVPFVPHLSHYWNKLYSRDYETWLELDFAWIDACDFLYRMPGDSPGGDREVIYARELVGKPVVCSMPELFGAAFKTARVVVDSTGVSLHLAQLGMESVCGQRNCALSSRSVEDWGEKSSFSWCRKCVTELVFL